MSLFDRQGEAALLLLLLLRQGVETLQRSGHQGDRFVVESLVAAQPREVAAVVGPFRPAEPQGFQVRVGLPLRDLRLLEVATAAKRFPLETVRPPQEPLRLRGGASACRQLTADRARQAGRRLHHH